MGSRQMVLFERFDFAVPLRGPLGPNALRQAHRVLRADLLFRQLFEIVRGFRISIPCALTDDFTQQCRRVTFNAQF